MTKMQDVVIHLNPSTLISESNLQFHSAYLYRYTMTTLLGCLETPIKTYPHGILMEHSSLNSTDSPRISKHNHQVHVQCTYVDPNFGFWRQNYYDLV